VFPLKDNIPTERFPVVTVAFIVLNVLAYFFFQHGELTLGDPSNASYVHNLWDYAYIPRELTDGVQCQPVESINAVRCTHESSGLPALYITVFTSLFMHGGLLHLAGNMLFLWIFGNNVEDAMGPVKFVLFYLLAGLAATAGQTLVDPHSAVPNIGASGAIAGVLGGYLVLFPRARVVTVIFIIFFFTIVELPAMIFLVIWFGQQILFGYLGLTSGTGNGGGVAYFAHIGGFAFGLLAIKLFASERRRRNQIERVGGLT
jgi:membrane associated rhomboid family serine protease